MSASFDGIVVGFDGSAPAELALRWAAETAARTDQDLRVLHVLQLEAVGMAPVSAAGWVYADDDAQALIDEHGARVAGEIWDSSRVHSERLVGSPSARLVAASETASMVVTGTRGHGELASAILGSTAYAVVAHAECPVVIVRGPDGATAAPQPGPGHPVVVGVDNVEQSGRALDGAADLAADTGALLRVLRAELVDPSMWGFSPGVADEAEIAAVIQSYDEHLVERVLTQVRERHPDLAVEAVVEHGNPAHLLAHASEGAGMVVVGSRGRGGFSGLLLGSVSHAVIHRAQCPVMVLR